MAVQRLLALVAGGIKEYVAAIVSTGASSAGQIVALNNAGVIDPTMMPPGVGADVYALTASEALAAGAYVNIWNTAGPPAARTGHGSVTGKQADGFVLAAVAQGAQATVYLAGINNAVSGQTAGLVYLSDTAVGAGATAGATTAGHTFQELGVAVSATAVQFNPGNPIVRA